MKKMKVSIVFVWAIILCMVIIGITQAQDAQQKPKSVLYLGGEKQNLAEEEAWSEVQGIDPTSLEKFLADFPNGKYADEAKLYLSLHKKIAAIRSKQERPSFVVPFEQLGERWEAWKKRRPDKDAVGIYRTEATAGIFSALGARKISTDYSGMVITPTGDGSIVAFQTHCLKYKYIGSLIIQCTGDEIMYFGVIHGVGLVHLHGRGKVIMPDGKEVQLPALQEVSGKVASVSMRTVAGPKSLFDTTLDLSEKDPKSTVVMTLEGKPAQEFRILTADIVNIDGFTDLKGKHEMMGGLLILSLLQERLVGKHVVLKCREIGRDDENDVYVVATLEVSKK